VSDEKQRPGTGAPSPAPGGPPKLERVPAGYKPGPTPRPSEGAARIEPRPAPPAAPPPPPATAPGASYGLAAREVGADAAMAAGIAHQGTLASDGPLRLFALAAALQATGRLTLSAEGRTYALSFRRGTVEHATSSDPEDDLGRFLVRKGALGEAQRSRAKAASEAAGGDLAAALIAEKLLNPAEVASLLQEHGAGIVQRALSPTGGGWSWDPAAPSPPGAFPLGAPFAMLCAAVRALDPAAIVERLGDREHRVASRVGGRIRLEDLRLNAHEARAAALFDGVRSPSELAAASPADALVVLRMSLLLGEVDLLAFGAPTKGRRPPGAAPAPGAAAKPASAPPQKAQRPAPAPAAAPARAPAPPRTASAPTPSPATTPPPPAARAPRAALEKDALEALVKKLASQGHFEALGVARTANGAQIKAAYFQLAKTYHPDAVPADAPPEIRKLCADVFGKISEAWSVLGEDASRAEYLLALETGGIHKLDAMNIFRAESLFEEGALLVKARRYAEAVRKFDEATRLNADEAEFGIWKAFCEFLLAADKRAKLPESAAAIEAGLKKNPLCAQGYLFLGQMAKVAGEIALAEKHLRRGLHVAPDHADLQRELKYLKR
jgi:tetratricopeptide (TPR) repeat protein